MKAKAGAEVRTDKLQSNPKKKKKKTKRFKRLAEMLQPIRFLPFFLFPSSPLSRSQLSRAAHDLIRIQIHARRLRPVWAAVAGRIAAAGSVGIQLDAAGVVDIRTVPDELPVLCLRDHGTTLVAGAVGNI